MNTNKEKQLKKIGKKIKEIRENLGMSQEELSFKCGYTSRSAINKIELGKTDISFSKIIIISNALGVHPHTLFNSGLTDEELNQGMYEFLKERYGSDVVKILEVYSKLNENNRKQSYILINGLLNEDKNN